MEHCCGHTFFETQKTQNIIEEVLFEEHSLVNSFAQFKPAVEELYSPYLGGVDINLLSTLDEDTLALEHTVTFGGKDLLIKVIDCKQHNLNHTSRYRLQQLEKLSAASVNKNDNRYYHYLILLSSKNIAERENRSEDVKKIESKLKEFKEDVDNFEEIYQRVVDNYPEVLDVKKKK